MFILSHKQLQKLLSVINTMGLNDLYRSILILQYDFNDELTIYADCNRWSFEDFQVMYSLSGQHIWQLILSDLQRFTQIVLKFKTCQTCVLNFRTICVNLCKWQNQSFCFGLIGDEICWSDKEQTVNHKHTDRSKKWICSFTNHSTLLRYCQVIKLLDCTYDQKIFILWKPIIPKLWQSQTISWHKNILATVPKLRSSYFWEI